MIDFKYRCYHYRYNLIVYIKYIELYENILMFVICLYFWLHNVFLLLTVRYEDIYCVMEVAYTLCLPSDNLNIFK